jgi:hypothetical protein
MIVRRYDDDEEAFLRQLIIPEEDRLRFTRSKWVGGYRWFRRGKVTPIEYWERLIMPAPMYKAG